MRGSNWCILGNELARSDKTDDEGRREGWSNRSERVLCNPPIPSSSSTSLPHIMQDIFRIKELSHSVNIRELSCPVNIRKLSSPVNIRELSPLIFDVPCHVDGAEE